jgi:hypothetical protein
VSWISMTSRVHVCNVKYNQAGWMGGPRERERTRERRWSESAHLNRRPCHLLSPLSILVRESVCVSVCMRLTVHTYAKDNEYYQYETDTVCVKQNVCVCFWQEAQGSHSNWITGFLASQHICRCIFRTITKASLESLLSASQTGALGCGQAGKHRPLLRTRWI